MLAGARETIWERDATIAGLAMLAIQQREQPHDLRAERRVLGALLVDAAAPADVEGIILGDFWGNGHREMFEALLIAHEAHPVAPPEQPRRVHFIVRALAHLFGWNPDRSLDALATLTPPRECPRDEIATVRALGRWRREHGR